MKGIAKVGPRLDRSRLYSRFVTTLAVVCAGTASADTWIGTPGEEAAFNDGANWSLEVVPEFEPAVIDNGGIATIAPEDDLFPERLIVGQTTTGNAVIQNGGTITTLGPLMVGFGAGSSGSYTMSNSATAVFGGTGESDNTSIGRSGGIGSMTLTGGSSLLVSSGQFFVGQGAESTGSLTLTDSEVSTTDWIAVGRGGGSGTATLNGKSRLFATGGGFVVGAPVGGVSTGSLFIKDESEVYYEGGNPMFVGEGAKGTVTVSGNGQFYSKASGIWVGTGANGDGILNLTENAISSAGNETYIGNDGAMGVVNLSGNARFSTEAHKFIISRFDGIGSVTVEGNAEISIGGQEIVVAENNTGTLTIRGNGRVLATGAAMNIYIGSAPFSDGGRAPGNGTVTMEGGQLVATDGEVILGLQANGTGTLHLNGGVVQAHAIRKGAGTGTIHFNGGGVKANHASEDYFAGFSSSDLVLHQGGLRFDTNGFEVAISQGFSGEGALIKLGDGVLTMLADAAYNGDTFVKEGRLTINSAFLADDSNVFLTEGSLFDLNFEGGDTINALIIDGVVMEVGTYGATGSGAEHTYDDYFSGTGYLIVTSTVIPEPSTVALCLFGFGGGLLLLRSRKKETV